MRLAVLAILTLSACASGPHVYADDGAPESIPKSARAHCRSWAGDLAKDVLREDTDIRTVACLDALLRADCADELARTATDLEEQGKSDAAFFFRFPGAWEPADVHQEVMQIANAACLPSGIAMMKALAMLEAIRNARGGRIPWASFGGPNPSGSMCRDGCK